MTRPVALVTGVGRVAGIGAAIAERLGRAGWDLATVGLPQYDERMPWGRRADEAEQIAARLRATGAATVALVADLADAAAPGELFAATEAALGPVSALVLSHAESVDSGLLDTSLAAWQRHFDVNARASWLLIAEFARRLRITDGSARIVALTSDHTAGNLPYGASKGALDRVVLAAARELAHLRVTANVINPGPVDTGWMSDPLKAEVVARTPPGRLGRPGDIAALVGFLCSADGGWVNGQLLHCDGGFSG